MNIAAQPIYFKSGGETLFGWLHLPPENLRSDRGIVICKPFGYEAICAHASIRAFANACASAGAAVLRFDYTGTGDSSGADSHADEISQWCDDIGAAMETLRRTCHVGRMGLLGVRFGALLAALAAADDSRVEDLIAVAPIVSGRRYLRELRAFQATSSSEAQSPSEHAAARDRDHFQSGGAIEVTGFSLSRASVDRLEITDLLGSGQRALASALILDRDDLPGAKPWADALRKLGGDVCYQALPGLLDMIATPHAAQIPREMIGAVLGYLARTTPGKESATVSAATDPAALSTSMRLTAEDGSRLIERALYVDEERALFAIATQLERPAGASASPQSHGVLMLNGGATSHIGPNRMYVELARRWAASGYVVLRLDLAGLGDSATRPGKSGNEVYPPGAVDDVSAAINCLRRDFGVAHVTLAGLCAGAYHALRSALSGVHVNTVLLVNPLTFYWKPGSKLSDLQVAEVVRNPGLYVERMRSGKSWRKLLAGRVNLWRVLKILVRRALLTLVSGVRDLTRQLNIRLPRDLGWELQSLAARGVRIVFLFARGDGGEDLLRVQGGSAVKSIGERCRVHIIDGADHIFSQRPARRELLQLLTEELPRQIPDQFAGSSRNTCPSVSSVQTYR
jgi:alpha-beta hydrolase superfamily lysophospholipase